MQHAPTLRRAIGARPVALTLAVAVAVGVAACGSSATVGLPSASPGPSTAGAASPGSAATPGETTTGATPSGATGGATLTPVPGGVTTSPGPPATRIPTTQTDWGAILDALPDSFPLYPGARQAEPPAEPASAAFDVSASVDRVAVWYRDTLTAEGFSLVDLSDPLEDGSRVLDVQSDVPECRIQLTFRPRGESTMILVLYGAGCAGSGP